MKRVLFLFCICLIFSCQKEPNCNHCLYWEKFPLQHERVGHFKLADFFPPKTILDNGINKMEFEVLRTEKRFGTWFLEEKNCNHLTIIFNKNGMVARIEQITPEGDSVNNAFEWIFNNKLKSIRNDYSPSNRGWNCYSGGIEQIDFYYDSIFLSKRVENRVYLNKDSTERKSPLTIQMFERDKNGRLIVERIFDFQGKEILQRPIEVFYDEQNNSIKKVFPPRADEEFALDSKEISFFDRNWEKLISYEWYDEESNKPSKWILNYDEFNKLISSDWKSSYKDGFRFNEKYHYSEEGYLSGLTFGFEKNACTMRLISIK